MTDFIDIVDAKPTDPEYTRGSTLQVTPDGLQVLGNLPHGYTFKPKTARDAAKLADVVTGGDWRESFAAMLENGEGRLHNGAEIGEVFADLMRGLYTGEYTPEDTETDPAVIAANNLDRAALIDAARETDKLNTEG